MLLDLLELVEVFFCICACVILVYVYFWFHFVRIVRSIFCILLPYACYIKISLHILIFSDSIITNFSWFLQWSKFVNWSIFDEVKAYEKSVPIFSTTLYGNSRPTYLPNSFGSSEHRRPYRIILFGDRGTRTQQPRGEPWNPNPGRWEPSPAL